MNTRNGLILAIDEVATATAFAMPAMPTHHTHAQPLPFFPALDARAYGFDFSNHLMAGNARVSESRKPAFHRKSIRVADATGLDPDSNLPKGGLDHCPLNDFQLARLGCLHCFVGPTHRVSFVFCGCCKMTSVIFTSSFEMRPIRHWLRCHAFPAYWNAAMELRHLRYFLAVGEALSFTKAAAQLRVAQPALGRQMQDLEDEIGVDLLRRSPRGVTLTAEG